MFRRPEGGTRYEAAAHLYDETIISGNSPEQIASFALRYSLERPSPHGRFVEAVAAFKRTYTDVQIPLPVSNVGGPRFRTERMPSASLTKHAALLDDLATLRQSEPSFRAVIFTRFNVTAHRASNARLVPGVSSPCPLCFPSATSLSGYSPQALRSATPL